MADTVGAGVGVAQEVAANWTRDTVLARLISLYDDAHADPGLRLDILKQILTLLPSSETAAPPSQIKDSYDRKLRERRGVVA